jgi:type II secretory pathway pseudopilin PulG
MNGIKHKTQKIKTSGYTLLETVAYVAIFIIILVSVLDMLVVLSKSFSRVRAYNQVRVSGMNAMERVSREIRTASSRDTGSTSDDLIINTTDEVGAAKTVEFYWDSTAKSINLVDNGIAKGALNGSSTEITTLVFYNASSSKSEVIKIEMTARSKKLTDISAKFYDTIVMRGGY